MRDSSLYLQDIIDRCDRLLPLVTGKTLDDFLADDVLHEVVLRHLTIIGEAVKQIPANVTDQEPLVPWRKIAKLRDILVHIYFGIRSEIIWQIVERDVSPLREACRRLLTPRPDVPGS